MYILYQLLKTIKKAGDGLKMSMKKEVSCKNNLWMNSPSSNISSVILELPQPAINIISSRLTNYDQEIWACKNVSAMSWGDIQRVIRKENLYDWFVPGSPSLGRQNTSGTNQKVQDLCLPMIDDDIV